MYGRYRDKASLTVLVSLILQRKRGIPVETLDCREINTVVVQVVFAFRPVPLVARELIVVTI